jgi:hypothetical protein
LPHVRDRSAFSHPCRVLALWCLCGGVRTTSTNCIICDLYTQTSWHIFHTPSYQRRGPILLYNYEHQTTNPGPVSPKLVIFGCRTKASSPASVLMVNTPLSPSQRPLRASLRGSGSILMVGCPRNHRGDCRSPTLTCLQPWHRPSRTGDQPRVRCLLGNHARWRSGGEGPCGG